MTRYCFYCGKELEKGCKSEEYSGFECTECGKVFKEKGSVIQVVQTKMKTD